MPGSELDLRSKIKSGETQPSISTYFFIALIAFASLAFELLQTRILSALYYNNIVYFTVTIALLGLGIAGVMVSLFYKKFKNPLQLAVLSSAGFALSIIFCLHAVSILPAIFPETPAIYKMLISYLILIIPFMFAGSALSIIFMEYGKNIFGLYFADLCASALATICFSILLWPLGAFYFALFCVTACWIAFLIKNSQAEIKIREIILFASITILYIVFLPIGNIPDPYKTAAFLEKYDKSIASAWTPISKIDIFNITPFSRSGEDSFMTLFQDNDAHTNIINKKTRDYIKKNAQLHRPTYLNTLAYFLNPNPNNVLVIGVGGGKDIVMARSYGAKQIDGVEINPATIHFVSHRFASYADWPRWQNIHIYNSEGRHFTRNSKKKYDVIVMSAVDTFAALNSGAYVLSENYLYTVEAIKDYLNALQTNGVMVIFRWFDLQPRESLRLANLFLSAAATTGKGDPAKRILVISEDNWAGTFIKREPFTANEIKMLSQIIKNEPFSWVYIPKVLGTDQNKFEQIQFEKNHVALKIAREDYAKLINATDSGERSQFENNYHFNISPTYDNRPFFFEYYKNKGFHSFKIEELRGSTVHYVLYILLFLTTMTCLLGMFVPLLIYGREEIKIKGVSGLIGFFSALGAGFMFIEIGCMQWLSLYLGHPMYSLMIVLSSLLLFTGCGSIVASFIQISILKKLQFAMFGSAILILLWLISMKLIMPFSEHETLLLRVTVVLLSLLPLGITMGIPFATGLHYLSQENSRFIPWAWGINGLTSVSASILAIIVAMKWGFTATILLGALTYILGYYAFKSHLRAIND